MAANPSSSTLLFAFLFLPAVLAITSLTDFNCPPLSLCQCNCPKESETRLHLHLYLHELPAWPAVLNPNEVFVIKPASAFGQMYVDDWFLTAGTDPNGKIIGRAYGFHIQASQAVQRWILSHIFEFQDDWFAGSTLKVEGLHPMGMGSNANGQWFITGGTGAFTNAHGTVKFSTASGSTEVIYVLDLHVFYTLENP